MQSLAKQCELADNTGAGLCQMPCVCISAVEQWSVIPEGQASVKFSAIDEETSSLNMNK